MPLCATVGLCVESANVVGYQNNEFDASGWMINVGVAFSNVGSVDGSFTLDDSFFSGEATEGDQFITLDADLWDLYTYEKAPAGDGWLVVAPDGSSEIVAGITFSKGDMLYYIPVVATTATVAGQVADTTQPQSVTFDVNNAEGKWMFPLVNPYPIDTTWGDLNAFMNEGDQLIMLDADLWDLYTYEKAPAGDGWLVVAPDGSSEIINDEDAVALPAGNAAYYIPTQTVTWTVTL